MVSDRPEPEVSLPGLFNGLQESLVAILTSGKVTVRHPTALGELTEGSWLHLLRERLPTRYIVENAFVVDSTGAISEQQDMVVFDRHFSPLLFRQGQTTYVPAESVYAVIEVRQDLSKANIEYAGGKAASVRRLKRTSAPVTHAGGEYAPREPFAILAGIVSLESSWNPPFGQPFVESLSGLAEEARVDIGCALQHGAFEVRYETDPRVEVSDSDTSLAFFFVRLLKRLQDFGSVPAIDLSEYGKVIPSRVLGGSDP